MSILLVVTFLTLPYLMNYSTNLLTQSVARSLHSIRASRQLYDC